MEVLAASSYDDRIYVRTRDQILQVVLTDAGTQVIASTKVVANILLHATQLFSGVALQSMLGATYASLFVSADQTPQVRIPELDKCRVIEARYDFGVLMTVVERMGRYFRQVFRFDPDATTTYDVREVPLPGMTELNFVTLASGVCVCMAEDRLELFSAKKGSQAIKYVEDSAITGDLILGKHIGSLIAFKGNRIFKLKMR